MKKLLIICVALTMVFVLAACAPAGGEPVTEAPVAEKPAVEEPVIGEPAVEEPAEVAYKPEYEYAPLMLDFKNKTGMTITGLYLYPSSAKDKGNSICEPEWIDKDADKDETHYEIFAYIVRPVVDTFDLYVEFADGTNATWEGLKIANYDKLSLKKGIDPALWEQEPVDDQEDIDKLDAVKAAGKTNDNFYPGYEVLGLEIKNKTGLNITEFYLYETGGDHTVYNNMVPCLVDAEGNAVTEWEPGKGGLYVFDFFLRPHADTYEVYVVYADGTTLTIPDIDLFTPNGDGYLSNEISMKDAVDPDITEVSYDDGDPEPLKYIADAIAEGIPADNWYPVY